MSRQLLAIAMFAAAASAAPAGAAVTDDQVAHAIGRLRSYFWANLDTATGTWEHLDSRSETYKGGVTAIVTLAMLAAGESPQDPRLARALAFLRRTKMDKTYCVALRAQVWGRLPDGQRDGLVQDAQWLLDAARAGSTYSYDNWRDSPFVADGGNPAPPLPPPGDHSNSQYGLLGMWEAARRGVKIDRSYWDAAVDYWLDAQNPDGGWDYSPRLDGPSYGSMTAAGLTALLVAQQQLYRDRPMPEPRLERAVRRGLAWLDERFAGMNNPGRGGAGHYYLYSVERVGLASGVRFLNGQDWFAAGADAIVRQVGDGGRAGGPVDTAFALLFLSRGRVPVWISKLSPGGDGGHGAPELASHLNNRPNDLHFLTRYLSDTVESELNWQTVPLDRDPLDWLNAPVAYLASDREVEFTPRQKANIKRYLDLGGLLLANADTGSGSFDKSVRKLAAELYPQWPMRKLGGEHPLFHLWHQVPNGGGQSVYAVANGARELIVLAGRDWGYDFQTHRDPNPQALTATFKLASNLFALATQRGRLPGRLDARYERRTPRDATGAVTIGRARYDGDWLAEPAAWEQVGNHVFNRTGLDVRVTPANVAEIDFSQEVPGATSAGGGGGVLDLSSMTDAKLPLVHLTGVEPHELTPPELDAILKYARAGGTILIETVGGKGGFAQSIEQQLTKALGRAAFPLPDTHPIFTGQGLPEGAYMIGRIDYRRHAVLTLGLRHTPRLLAFTVNDRPAILISAEDLTLGAMDVPREDVIGYEPATALKIMTNLVLWASGKDSKATEPRSNR